jgi:aspartate 1-decarboxylase
MQVNLLRSKILRATITEANADYEGSLAIDASWMEMIGLLPYEKILVGNITNGLRLETYAIPAPKGSGVIALNGAAAHCGAPGQLLVIMSFAWMSESEAQTWTPRVLLLSDGNRTSRIIDKGEAKTHLITV